MHSAGDDVLFHPTMQHFKWRRGRGGWGGGGGGWVALKEGLNGVN